MQQQLVERKGENPWRIMMPRRKTGKTNRSKSQRTALTAVAVASAADEATGKSGASSLSEACPGYDLSNRLIMEDL